MISTSLGHATEGSESPSRHNQIILSQPEVIELPSDSFTLRFDAEGRPVSCVRKADGAELLPKGQPGEGFFLKSPDGAAERFSRLSLESEGRLLVANADGSKRVRMALKHGARHLAFRIESVEGIDPKRFESFHFSTPASRQLRVLNLDYILLSDGEKGGDVLRPLTMRVNPFADSKVEFLSDHSAVEATLTWDSGFTLGSLRSSRSRQGIWGTPMPEMMSMIVEHRASGEPWAASFR